MNELQKFLQQLEQRFKYLKSKDAKKEMNKVERKAQKYECELTIVALQMEIQKIRKNG